MTKVNEDKITAYIFSADGFKQLVAIMKQLHENGGEQRDIAGFMAWSLYEAKELTDDDIQKLLTEEELAGLAAARGNSATSN